MMDKNYLQGVMCWLGKKKGVLVLLGDEFGLLGMYCCCQGLVLFMLGFIKESI